MKIQVGKTYKNGLGESVKIVQHDECDDTYRGSDTCWYYNTGQPIGFSDESEWDLVAEVSDTPEVSVGDVWMTRGGTRVKIIATDIPGDEPIAGYPLEYDYESDPSASRVWSFSPVGRMHYDEEGVDDLVSKEEKPVAWLVRSVDGRGAPVFVELEEEARKWATFVTGLTVHPLFERP
jgi:hypothetical protein